MARTTKQNKSNTSAEAEVPTQTEEVSVTTTEAPEADTEPRTLAEATSPVAPKADKPKAEAPDISVFLEAAESALSSTTDEGSITDEALQDTIEAYRQLDGVKAKNAARTWVNDTMKEAMNVDNFVKAKGAFNLHKSLTESGTGGGTAAPKKDPTEAFVERIVIVRLGFESLQRSVPDGVSENWKELAKEKADALSPQLTSYVAWLNRDEGDDTEEPEVDPIVLAALKVGRKGVKASGTKSVSTGAVYTGPQRSIAKHIEEAFASQEVGTFLKINDIVKFNSREYGADHPSPGAIAGALKSPKFAIEGVEPAEDETGRKGARKVA